MSFFSSPPPLILLILVLSSSSSFNLVSCSTINLPLLSSSHFTTFTNPSISDPFLYLNQLATNSLNRAHHLKHGHKPTITTINKSKTPLSSHSYGAYSVSLSFGTPPQTIPFVMDTGSDLVWFPCTHRYQCKNCDSSRNVKVPTFIPKSSSSTRVLGCVNPKCAWIHDSDVQSRCTDCQSGFRNCTQICPPYLVVYGSGSTGGVLLSETLDFGKKSVPNFIVGCSVFSSHQPAGIVGFGRGLASLPSQMGLNKFSYCLISRRFDDDTSKTSSMVLETGSKSGSKTEGVSYTPFIKNPIVADKHAFSVYYYVGLRKITVGGKHVKVPHKYFTTGSDGSGGTIIDSGTTFTYMTGEVFNLVASEFIEQVKDYERVPEIESLTGLKPCFNISQHKTLTLPAMKFQFKGGLEMVLPLANYFIVPDDSGVACLSMVTDGVEGVDVSGGPSIILGNFQMQNYYVEYDLRNERLGLRQQKCL